MNTESKLSLGLGEKKKGSGLWKADRKGRAKNSRRAKELRTSAERLSG